MNFTLKPIQCKKKTLIVTAFVNIKLAEIQNLQMLHRSVERCNIIRCEQKKKTKALEISRSLTLDRYFTKAAGVREPAAGVEETDFAGADAIVSDK